jgi:hypothetical protein
MTAELTLERSVYGATTLTMIGREAAQKALVDQI